jgi:hypothetical protein
MRDRVEEAKSVIRRNVAPRGFYTGEDYRQYWIREAVSFPALLRLGWRDRVEAHVAGFLDRMEPSGRVPAQIPTREGLVRLATAPRVWLYPLRYQGPYLLRNAGRWLDALRGSQPWTSDGEILALLGLKALEEAGSDLVRLRAPQVRRLQERVASASDPSTGLVPGAGWADAMEVYDRRPCLVGLALQHRMHSAWGQAREANRLRSTLEEVFWDPGRKFYRDCAAGDRFDTVAHALLLSDGAIPEERVPGVLRALEETATPFGYRNLHPPYPAHRCGQWPFVYQNSTVWPFAQGLVIAALSKIGEQHTAEREMEKWNALPGFGEWHEPRTGRRGGSAGMLSSAALFLEAARELGLEGVR